MNLLNLLDLPPLELFVLISFFLGLIGGFIGIFIGVCVAKKWMVEVVDILEDGFSFYTTGAIFGFLGVLQYATVFFWSCYAKRIGMLEKREQVPKHIQKWFIIAYCVFMSSTVIFFTGAAIVMIFFDEV